MNARPALLLLVLAVTSCSSPPAPTPSAAPAAAAPTPAPEPPKPAPIPVDCKPYAEMARQMMLSRQAGIPMSDVMDIVKDHPDGPKLVIAAFEVPRYTTERYQQREVTEFQNAAFMACVKGNATR